MQRAKFARRNQTVIDKAANKMCARSPTATRRMRNNCACQRDGANQKSYQCIVQICDKARAK